MTTSGLFIGRFQPFHIGHLATVTFALQKVGRLVIVVGSAQKSHESRNPFTAGERIMMIKTSINHHNRIDASRILIVPVPDIDVHTLWTHQVDILVPMYDFVFANDPFTCFLFRERAIKVIVPPLLRRNELSATHIRKMMLSGGDWKKLVPAQVVKIVNDIKGSERLKVVAKKDQSVKENNITRNLNHRIK